MRLVDQKRANRERKPDNRVGAPDKEIFAKVKAADKGKVLCRIDEKTVILVKKGDPRLKTQCKKHP